MTEPKKEVNQEEVGVKKVLATLQERQPKSVEERKSMEGELSRAWQSRSD